MKDDVESKRPLLPPGYKSSTYVAQFFAPQDLLRFKKSIWQYGISFEILEGRAQRQQTGEYFKAFYQLIADLHKSSQEPRQLIILLADTLQIHTQNIFNILPEKELREKSESKPWYSTKLLSINELIIKAIQEEGIEWIQAHTSEKLREAALTAGKQWLIENTDALEYIKTLEIELTIYHWREVIEKITADGSLAFFKKLAADDTKSFGKILKETAIAFYRNKKNNLKKNQLILPEEIALPFLQEYLLEESAQLLLMATQAKVDFMLYPGIFNATMLEIRDNRLLYWKKLSIQSAWDEENLVKIQQLIESHSLLDVRIEFISTKTYFNAQKHAQKDEKSLRISKRPTQKNPSFDRITRAELFKRTVSTLSKLGTEVMPLLEYLNSCMSLSPTKSSGSATAVPPARSPIHSLPLNTSVKYHADRLKRNLSVNSLATDSRKGLFFSGRSKSHLSPSPRPKHKTLKRITVNAKKFTPYAKDK